MKRFGDIHRIRHFHVAMIKGTVDQLMFAAINVRVFAKQTSSLLLMFVDSCHEE